MRRCLLAAVSLTSFIGRCGAILLTTVMEIYAYIYTTDTSFHASTKQVLARVTMLVLLCHMTYTHKNIGGALSVCVASLCLPTASHSQYIRQLYN